MKKNFLLLLLFIAGKPALFAQTGQTQKTSFVYVNAFSKKLKQTNCPADIYVVQKKEATYHYSLYVRTDSSAYFDQIPIQSDTTAFQLVFDVVRCFTFTKYNDQYTGDLNFSRGDSILYNVDAGRFTIINKNRPGR